MAYKRTIWQNHVTQYEDRYTETKNSDGTTTLTSFEGTLIQQGTPQDENRFNNMEEGILAANETSAESIRMLLMHERELGQPNGEIGVTAFTNTLAYPFNNSVKTIAFSIPKNTLDYTVSVEVKTSVGSVGNVTVSDKQLNGFKLSYSGGASSATLRYTVRGGF